jgi:NAD-dependent dihydropyrimidine dehydrogenase PreA subunit
VTASPIERVTNVLVADTCTACGLCIMTCPEGALLPDRKRPRAAVGRCTACLACVEICPRDAIEIWPRDLLEVRP